MSERLAPNQRRLLLSIYVPPILVGLCKGMVLPVLPLFALSFEVSYGLVGALLAAQGMGNLASDLPAGVAMRRLGCKRSMVLGGVIIALSGLAMFFAQTLWEAIAYRLISGAGLGLWNISRHAYITDLVRIQARGRMNAGLGGVGRITAFVGPLTGGIIAGSLGLQVPFLIYGGVASLAVLATLGLVFSDSVSGSARRGDTPVGLRTVLRQNRTILMRAGTGALMAQTIRAARNVIVPLFAAEQLGLDAKDVGVIISASYAIDMLLFMPAGIIMDRFGRKFAYVPSFLIQSSAMAVIPFADSFTSLLAATLALGAGNGIGSGTMLTLGADLSPPQARGEFLGIWRFIGDSGHAAGPLIVGRAADLLGLMATPFIVAAIGLLGAGVLGLLVPETLVRDESVTKAKPVEGSS